MIPTTRFGAGNNALSRYLDLVRKDGAEDDARTIQADWRQAEPIVRKHLQPTSYGKPYTMTVLESLGMIWANLGSSAQIQFEQALKDNLHMGRLLLGFAEQARQRY